MEEINITRPATEVGRTALGLARGGRLDGLDGWLMAIKKLPTSSPLRAQIEELNVRQTEARQLLKRELCEFADKHGPEILEAMKRDPSAVNKLKELILGSAASSNDFLK